MKRRYALHMKDNMPTIEGLLVKRTRHAYVLIAAKVVESEDASHSLANHVEVPRENVYCLQRLA